jgi:hypothetical protein
MTIAPALLLALLACSPIEQQSNLARTSVAGKVQVAGNGDVVMDLRKTESLPNLYGKADVFGRSRDTGRVTVRFLGVEGNQAIFVRQDVAIQSNETTMSRSRER